MNPPSNIAHMTVETGPDQGRPLTVTPAGVRIGRSSQNDIELSDPSVSRFQCRVFFKPDGLLWIADLGSTNETLVNGAPVLEQRLKVGDAIEIGESTIRVLIDRNDLAVAEPASASATRPAVTPLPAPAPVFAPKAEPDATPVPPPPQQIDLGLKPTLGSSGSGESSGGGAAKSWLWLVLVLAIAAAALAVMKSGLFKPKAGGFGSSTATDAAFSIYYEKVQGSVSNIYRFEMTLDEGVANVRADSLSDQRHIAPKQHTVKKEVLEKLMDDLNQSGFFKLEDAYTGLNPSAYEAFDLTVTIGLKTHHSLVLNRVEHEDFKKARELIELFAKNEFGLFSLGRSPDELITLAGDSTKLGQKLFGEREVEYGNLWKSIHAFQEAQVYLETIDPKPDFYQTTVTGLDESRDALNKQYEDYTFRVGKSVKLNDWDEAARNLKIIKELVPDRDDRRYKDADKQLIEIETRSRR